MPRQSAVAKGCGVTSGAATHPAFLEKGGGGGCEETDFIRRE